MTTEIKHWVSVENTRTGESEGLLCFECRKGYPFKYGVHEISCSESNWNASCSCCNRKLIEDYVKCPECDQIYPRGHDYRVEEGKECCPCHISI